jgi:chromosome segregation ATPase
MMNEKNAVTFQFGNEEESPETILQDELQKLKIEKLSNRVTLLTILIPFMIGIILVIAYLDIKNRVARTHNSDATSIERISKDLDSKFSSLSLEQAKIKDIHSKKMPSIEKSIASLQSGLKSTQSLLKKLESSSLGREEMFQAMESLNGKNQELSDSMKIEIETLKDIGNQMGKDVEDVSNSLYALKKNLTEVKYGFDRLNTDISNLSEEKIGRKELNLALKLREISNRQELLKTKATLDKRIDNLKKKQSIYKSNQGPTVAVQTIKGSKRSKEKPVQPQIDPAVIPGTDKSKEHAATSSSSTIDGIEEQNIE